MDNDLASHVVGTWEDLVSFLDGSPTSFTGQLVTLIEKADPGNRARLREAFPRHVAAWEAWREFAPLTRGRLEALTEARVKTSGGGRPAFSFADLQEMFYLLGDPPEPGHARARLEIVASGGTVGISVPDISVTWERGRCTAAYEEEGIAWQGTGAGECPAIFALLADRVGYKAVVTFKDDDEAGSEDGDAG